MKITEMIEIDGKFYPHIREMTAEEKELENLVESIPYEQRVVNRIREVYSVDDELAILRQRDTKPEEFEEYNSFVESIKAQEKSK